MDEVRPLFVERYGRFAGKSSPRLGERVNVSVLTGEDFVLQQRVHQQEILQQLHAMVTTYIPDLASKRISGVGTAAQVTLIPVTKSTRLTPAQLRLILPDLPSGSGTTAAAFYSNARKTIFIKNDEVDAGTVAHELTHAYCHPLWRELHFALKLQSASLTSGFARGLEVWEAFRRVDEGLASALAQPVVDDWFYTPVRKGMSPRPSSLPETIGGYLPEVRTQTQHFVGVIDGTLGTPGANSLRAYFGGQLNFTIDEASPLDSDVQFGRDKNRKLRDVL